MKCKVSSKERAGLESMTVSYSEYGFAFPELNASAKIPGHGLTACRIHCHAFCTVTSNYTTHLTANEVQHGPVLLEFTGPAMSLIPLKQLA